MQKYFNSIFGANGVATPGASVAVFLYGTTTPAMLFSDSAGAHEKSNPIITDQSGYFDFYAADGRYSYTVTAVGFSTKTLTDIQLEDVSNGLAVYAAPSGSSLVGYMPAGVGAVATTVGSKLRESVSVKDFGAVGDGVTDDTAAFTAAGSSSLVTKVDVTPGTYKLNSDPAPTGNITWIIHKGASFIGVGTLSFASNKIVSIGDYRSIESSSSFYDGVFGYMEQNAALSGYGVIGLHGAAQSAGGSGGAGEADIGVAGFAAHNLAGSAGGVWAMYGTAIKSGAVTGSTIGLELDIANTGSTVDISPPAMFAAGLTAALWLGSGGEAANIVDVGDASCAIGILSNDAIPGNGYAAFSKGIVFHNRAIAGTDGATGNGIAIAFANRHQMIWFNNSGQATGEITTTCEDANKSLRLEIADTGLNIANRVGGQIQFNVESVAGSANYVNIVATGSGGGPQLQALGSDTNIDVTLAPKGSGVLQVTYGSSEVTSPAAFSATRKLGFKDGNGVLWYLPVSTTPW